MPYLYGEIEAVFFLRFIHLFAYFDRVTRISGDGKEFEDTIKNMLSGTKFSLEKKVRISLTDFTDCFGPEHNAEIDIKNLTLAIESLRKTLDECQADKKVLLGFANTLSTMQKILLN